MSIGLTIPRRWQTECLCEHKKLRFCKKKSHTKNISNRIPPKFIYTKFCSDWMDCYQFIKQKSEFLLTSTTVAILGQGHGKAIQYIYPIGRSPRRRFLDHAFMPHCTFSPHLLAQQGSVAHLKGGERSLAAFNVTLLILVLEIPFNF